MLEKHLLERRQFSEACVEVEELLLADAEEMREEAVSLEDEVQDQSSQVRVGRFVVTGACGALVLSLKSSHFEIIRWLLAR